ncbi:MAG: hypothetical protein JNL80_01625, partial [Phycisphaerae bacterium]|nr:hypothetical protein [Phycisphaerae bacterium]
MLRPKVGSFGPLASVLLATSLAHDCFAAVQAPPAPAVQTEPGLTFRVYQLDRAPATLPTLIANQTPNADRVQLSLDLRNAA